MRRPQMDVVDAYSVNIDRENCPLHFAMVLPFEMFHIDTAHERGGLAALRGPIRHVRYSRQPFDHIGARGFLQRDDVWFRLSNDVREELFAAYASKTDVIAHQPEHHPPRQECPPAAGTAGPATFP